MILPLFRRHRRPDTIAALYGTIVAQARSRAFYLDYGVSDTVNGRFELIVLHLALVLRRMFGEDEQLRDLGQGVFDEFCRDMDGNLREMGVGDLSVPKHMRRIGDDFYGRAQAYDAALADPEAEALARSLARNIYEQTAVSPAAIRLAAYARTALDQLRAEDAGRLAAGELSFPDPAAIAAD